MAGVNRAPPPPPPRQTFQQAPKKRKMSARRCLPLASAEAWHYIYVVTPRVNGGLPVPRSWEREGKEKERNKESRYRQGGPVGSCLQTSPLAHPRSLLIHRDIDTIRNSLDTCILELVIVKPSSRIAKKAMGLLSDKFDALIRSDSGISEVIISLK